MHCLIIYRSIYQVAAWWRCMGTMQVDRLVDMRYCAICIPMHVKNMNTLATTAKINQSSPRASCAHKLSTVGRNQSSSASNWSIKSHTSPANTRTFTNSGIRKKRRNSGRKMRR